MTVLVTGGLGYIGAHTCVALMEAGHQVVILDNLCNTSAAVADGIRAITGAAPAVYTGDVADREMLRKIFSKQEISAVVHFAALKSAPGSVEEPLAYYRNNLAGSLTLIEEMDRAGVRRMLRRMVRSWDFIRIPRQVPTATPAAIPAQKGVVHMVRPPFREFVCGRRH